MRFRSRAIAHNEFGIALGMEQFSKGMLMKVFLVSCTAVALLTGCALMAPAGPSGEPSQTQPRMVATTDSKTWDNPALFGEVPRDLQSSGDAYCQDFGFERAAGYHPKPLDENGDPFDGGGFYCVGEKKNG
jgi:hypothetical protein